MQIMSHQSVTNAHMSHLFDTSLTSLLKICLLPFPSKSNLYPAFKESNIKRLLAVNDIIFMSLNMEKKLKVQDCDIVILKSRLLV